MPNGPYTGPLKVRVIPPGVLGDELRDQKLQVGWAGWKQQSPRRGHLIQSARNQERVATRKERANGKRRAVRRRDRRAADPGRPSGRVRADDDRQA